MKRALGILATIALTLIAAGALAVLVVTRSDTGREWARHKAEQVLNSSVNGRVVIGHLEGNLLGRFTLSAVAIADSTGAPFFSADRISATLDARRLWSKRVVLSHIALERPVVHLTRAPNAAWNALGIFPSSDSITAKRPPGFGSWVSLYDVSVTNGTLIVQQPWTLNSRLKGTARDSAIAATLAGRARDRVDRVAYGLRQTMDFTAIDARLAHIIVATPDSADIVMQLDTLSMIAAPFQAPTIAVRQFAAAIRVGTDSVTARPLVLQLPASHATGSLTYYMATSDVVTSLALDTLAFADIRALYPPLPESGGGRLKLRAAIRVSTPSEYLARDLELRVGSASVAGAIGVTVDDSTTQFRDADLRFTRISTALVEQLAPGITSPAAAQFGGRAQFTGPLQAMQVDVNATVSVARQPAFRVSARGGFGVGDAVTAHGLRVRGDRIPVSVAREFHVDVPLGGTVNVTASITGSSASRVRGTATVAHEDQGSVSRMSAEGTIGVTKDLPMDVALRFDSVALALTQHWLPDSVTVHGALTGTAHVSGTTRDLASQLHLTLPEGGTVDGNVTFRTPSDTIPVYAAALTVGSVNLYPIMPSLPVTALNGAVTLTGRGLSGATANAAFSANLAGRVDSAEFREVVLQGTAREGLLAIDTLRLDAAFASVTASGTFGLVGTKHGTLRFRGEVPDLKALSPWIAVGDTGVVAARPARGVQLARRAARDDSIRQVALAARDPAALLAAEQAHVAPTGKREAPKPIVVHRDSIAGSVVVTGVVEGNIEHALATANVHTRDVVVRGNQITTGAVVATWKHDSATRDTITAAGMLNGLQLAGFSFDSTRLRVRYVNRTGDAHVAVFVGDSASASSAAYILDANYAFAPGGTEGELHIRDLQLRADSTRWRSTRQSTVRWRVGDIAIDSLDLRDADGRGTGRIVVSGGMPAVESGRLMLTWDSVGVSPFLAMAQSDVVADGSASGRLLLEGPRASPRFQGAFTVTRPRYNGTDFPQVHATLGYDARSLTIDADATRATGGRLARIAGTIPLDLSLTDSAINRLPDAPVALVVEGDSIPLSPFGELTSELTDLVGRAYGRMTVTGTVHQPHLSGAMSVDMDQVRIAYTGVAYSNVIARLHMVGDTLVLDSLTGTSGGPIRGSGTIVLADLTQPVFQLAVESTDALVIDDARGKLFAESRITVSGSLDTLAVGGRVTITRGVIRIPDPESFEVISTDDPAIFAVVDTATARELGIATESEMLRNLRLAVDVRVNRGTFARSRDANIEVYGDMRVRLDSTTQGLFGLTGQLLTDYGDYRFLSKRFIVTRGSVRFTGGTDLNPLLQVMASYKVPQAGRAPLDIRVVIGGTLERPVVSLESDAQPAMSNSDLIAMLAFGRSSSSLLQFSGTSLGGGGQAGSPLTGNMAALSTQMLGSIALGALVDKSTTDLARRTRADVLYLTPGDLPADLSINGIQTLLKGTEIEIGKYINRQTFVVARVRPTLTVPGASYERRIGDSFKWRANFDSRYVSSTPSLSAGIAPRTIKVIGSMFAWTIVW